MSDKRFQECGRAEQIWRYRWYLALPFLWVWHQVSPFVVTDDSDGTCEKVKGRNLWRVLVGTMQYKMRWYYTMDEVRDRIKLLSEDPCRASSRSRRRDRA